MTARVRQMQRRGSPALVRHMNAATLWALPENSSAPKEPAEQFQRLSDLGVEALQHPFPQMIQPGPLLLAGMGRINEPGEALLLAQTHRDAGYRCTTLHVGSGFETEPQIDRLVGAIVEASDVTGYPLFVETHRATITQDIRRTLDFITRFPEVRLNADLSHWYTGHEMTYGDWNAKLDALTPVFERVRYLHGRIGTACCAQVAINGPEDDRDFVQHFREMWRLCAQGFRKTAAEDEALPFAPELLPYEMKFADRVHRFYYARHLGSNADSPEESDRWVQARYLWQVMESAASGILTD